MDEIKAKESNAFGWFLNSDPRSPASDPVPTIRLPRVRNRSQSQSVQKWPSECCLPAADVMENRRWTSTEDLDVTVIPVTFRKPVFPLHVIPCQQSSDSCLGSDWSEESRTYQSTPSLLEEDQVVSDIKHALSRLSSVTEHYKYMREELGTIRTSFEGLHDEMERFRERMQRTRYRPIARKPATFSRNAAEITQEELADVTYRILKQVCIEQLNLDDREHNFLV